MFSFYFISVPPITVTWTSSFGAHRFKLEAHDFTSHTLNSSEETFQTSVWNTYFEFCKKSSGFIFFLIWFSYGIYLLTVWLKRSKRWTHIFSLSTVRWQMIVENNRNTNLFFQDKHFYDNHSIKREITDQIYLNYWCSGSDCF